MKAGHGSIWRELTGVSGGDHEQSHIRMTGFGASDPLPCHLQGDLCVARPRSPGQLVFFKFFKMFLLKYNCFPMLCSFLLYNRVGQLYEYIYPLPLEHPPAPSHPSSSSQSTEQNSLCCGPLFSSFSTLSTTSWDGCVEWGPPSLPAPRRRAS